MNVNKIAFSVAYLKNRLSVFNDFRFVVFLSVILINSLNVGGQSLEFVSVQIPSNAIVTKEVVVSEKKKSKENKA